MVPIGNSECMPMIPFCPITSVNLKEDVNENSARHKIPEIFVGSSGDNIAILPLLEKSSP